MISSKKTQSDFRYHTAMLVDDSELDNFINQKMVEAHRFSERLYIYSMAADALSFLEKTDPDDFPDVVFVDLNMPLMDGFQFIEKLRQLPIAQKKRPRLVILTSSVSPHDRLRAAELGDIVFLNKPLTKEMLGFV